MVRRRTQPELGLLRFLTLAIGSKLRQRGSRF